MPFNPEITKTGRKNRKKKKQANTKTLGKSSSFDYLSTDKPLVENNMAKDFGTDILALDLVFFSVLQSCGGMENIRRCVCIIYDPSRSDQGVLALKALKLFDSFMELYHNNNFTREKLREKNLSWVDIFEETRFISNQSALMTELEPDTLVNQFVFTYVVPLQCDYDHLQLSTSSLMERNTIFFIQCMDDLSLEQQKELFINIRQTIKNPNIKTQTQTFILNNMIHSEATLKPIHNN
ncbi:Eukaryotic translation initiation factor 3 subunit H [Glycine max]|nr:Eukaryotic translation initiation factor 3 subunit H [Glycine max]